GARESPVPRARLGHYDAGLGPHPAEVSLPGLEVGGPALSLGGAQARLLLFLFGAKPRLLLRLRLCHFPAPVADTGRTPDQQHGENEDKPGEAALAYARLLTHCGAIRQVGFDVGEARAVAVEALERLPAILVNGVTDGVQPDAQVLRRIAANDRDHHRQRPGFAPQAQVAQPQRVDRLLPAPLERVAYEILDRRQHRGDELRVLAGGIGCRDVRDQQTRVVMDEKNVLDLVDQRVVEHHFGEGLAGAPGFDPPTQPAPAETLAQRFVQRLEGVVDRLADRLANRRTDHGLQ